MALESHQNWLGEFPPEQLPERFSHAGNTLPGLQCAAYVGNAGLQEYLAL